MDWARHEMARTDGYPLRLGRPGEPERLLHSLLDPVPFPFAGVVPRPPPSAQPLGVGIRAAHRKRDGRRPQK